MIARHRVAAGGLALGLLVALMSVFVASGTPQQVSFYACLNPNSHQIYNVIQEPDSPLDCHNGDVAVTWNQPQSLTLADGSVTNPKLAADAVTGDKIQDGSVQTADLADSAVTSAKIKDGDVTGNDLALGAVGTENIASGAVTTNDLGDGSVTEAKLADGGVTTGKLGDAAVTADKIADNAVATSDLQDLAVTTDKLANDAVTTTKIADGAVGTADLADGAITEYKIASETVTGAEIKDGTVTSNDLAFDAVGNDELQSGAVTTDKQTANASQGATAGGSIITEPGTPVTATTATLNLPGWVYENKDHAITLTAQVNLAITGAGSSTVVHCQIFDVTSGQPEATVSMDVAASVPVGVEYLTLPASALTSGQQGIAHSYALRVWYTSLEVSAPTISISSANLIAVDLGQVP